MYDTKQSEEVVVKDESEIEFVETPTKKWNENMKMFMFGIAGLIVLSIIISGAIGIYRVYAKAGTDGFTVAVAKVLRLSALKVDGERVLYSDYADDLKAIKIMRDFDKANNGANADLTDEQMSDQVLWRLANNILLNKAASEFEITVEDSEIEDLKSQVLSQFKDNATMEAELSKRYGWTMETYAKKVMRPFIIQNKLNEKLLEDKSLGDAVQAQANDVLNRIKAGADFAEMAKQYGQDGTAQQGGDLGWFAKEDMVPEFSDASFALKKGEITQNLVETQYGYHIIKLIDRKTEKVKDEITKKDKNVEKIQASHILFRFPDVNQYMDSVARKAEYHLYVKVHNPFLEVASVNG